MDTNLELPFDCHYGEALVVTKDAKVFPNTSPQEHQAKDYNLLCTKKKILDKSRNNCVLNKAQRAAASLSLNCFATHTAYDNRMD